LVRLWEVESGREVRSWLGDKTAVTLVAFSPDGRRIAWTGYGTNIMLAESSFLERR
jgi:WD40 repeat protein